MIEVRIRNEDDARSVHLTEVPYDAVDRVIPLLQRWGIGDGAGDLVGQFVVIDEAAFFEVVVMGGER